MQETKILTVSKCASPRGFLNYSFFPLLRLRGKWLQNLGFMPGTRYQVSTQGNSILLTPLND